VKIAIVGSGASAVGVLSGLESAGVDARITVFSGDGYFNFSPDDRYSVVDIDRF
jgi:cation diffusion facilitator CzcD-associated flavoprotein CzcO